MKQITITVSPSGSTTIKTEGFEGTSCRQATAEIERALGQVTSDKPTLEASSGQQLQSRNRS